MGRETNGRMECDVLVVGSGAGGLTTAITARKAGLNVVIIEKEPVFGGTTALSGGVLWIPGSGCFGEGIPSDSTDAAKEYLKVEAGNQYAPEMVEAFLRSGPKMVDFFQRETSVRFLPTLYPDYHPDRPGGADIGRSILAAPFDASQLGAELKRLKPPLESITFMGMMFNSSNADLKHFFNATRSFRSAMYVARRLSQHMLEFARYGRGIKVTSGNALAARLAKSALDLDIPILTSTLAERLIESGGSISGAQVSRDGVAVEITARRGVVLATGGFPHALERLRTAYPHVARGAEHLSPTPAGNTGDGIQMAEAAGGHFSTSYPNAAAWMPVSKARLSGNRIGAFPHLVDRYKPGVIAVTRDGRRFCNEADSYHDFGEAMISACADMPDTEAWLLTDHRAIRKYGLGHVKPAPVPLGGYVRNGYLLRGRSIAELAEKAGIDRSALVETVEIYNRHARKGEDPEFGRGTTAFNRYLADPANKPNPCVAPLEDGPFYAVRLVMGDLGTFDGLRTDAEGRVLDHEYRPIAGLYAAGNDRASMMGGAYPGAGITLGPIMTFAYRTGLALAGETIE